MKKILITQRSIFDQERQELLDCLDSKFSDLLGNDFDLIPVPNNAPNPQNFAENLACEGIILSGGNSIVIGDQGYSDTRQGCEKQLLDYAIRNNLPVIGICYGMQFMNSYFGGSICKVEKHARTKHTVKIDDLNFTVNSYHNYGISIKNLAESLLPVGLCADRTVEICIHDSLPWLGMMWHPERSIAKQKLWIEMIKRIFNRDLLLKKSNITGYLRKNYESYCS